MIMLVLYCLSDLIISLYLTLMVSSTPDIGLHALLLTPFHGFIVHMPKLYILSCNLSWGSSLS